jgi:soluble lytic murein transglycosylase
MTLQRTHLFLLLLLVAAGVSACQRQDGAIDPIPSPPVTTTLAPTFTPEGGVVLPLSTMERGQGGEGATFTPTPPPTPTPDLQPAERLAAGRAADRLGNWEEAQGWYATLINDRTYGHAAMFYAGDLYFRRSLYVEAAAAWTAGIELDPDGEFAAPMLYRLGRGMAGLGQHESAIALYLRADEGSDAADAVIAQRLAESYAEMGDMENALAQWTRVYEEPRTLRVNRALTAQQIGDWYAENEEWVEAIEWYAAALEGSVVESYRADLIYKQGLAAMQAGETERARAYWQAVLDEYPGEAAALQAVTQLEQVGRIFTPLELGDLYYANEEYTNASAAYVTALEEGAHSAEGHAGLARSSEANGNLSSAVEEWTKIIETHPESVELYPEAWYNIGRLQARLGDSTAAFAAWQTVIDQYPDSAFAGESLWAWGNVYRDSGSMAEAIAKWGQLATDYPDHSRRAGVLWAMGLAHYREADYAEAQAAFTTLAEVDSRPTRALFWAGKAAGAAGDDESAQTLWEQTIATNPADYYALRAADLLAEEAWTARGHQTVNPPTPEFVIEGEGLSADEPMVAQGELLTLMGESGWANSSFVVANATHNDNPAALWQITQRLHEIGAYNAGSDAARRLMNAEGYTLLDAPPDLLAYAYPLPYAPELVAATEEFNEDPLFVAAMIYQESRWQAGAQSSAAARGLLQVIPDTGRWVANRLGDTDFTPADLYRPLTSLRYGTYYLDYCLDEFDDNPYMAIAAYNGGPGNAARWAADDPDLFVEQITFAETRSYVELVYTHYHAYGRAYGEE